MEIRIRLFGLDGKENYCPVVFKEKDYLSAVVTAVCADSTLYIWNEGASKWDTIFSPFASDNENALHLKKQGIHPEQFRKEFDYKKCRKDVLFEKTDAYYYSGAGIIVLPERIVINRCSLFDDKELPTCPLHEYDIYSVADYQEMERMLHDMPPYIPEKQKLPEEDSEEEEFSFGENPTFHRVYTYLPYTHWRLKEILSKYFNAYMVCIRGYKEGRYQPGYKQRYNIYLNGSGYLLGKNIHLNTLRCIFAEREFPLHEPDTGRNQGAEMFLTIIQQLAEQQNI